MIGRRGAIPAVFFLDLENVSAMALNGADQRVRTTIFTR